MNVARAARALMAAAAMLLAAAQANAQNDYRLALEYYRNREFEKAEPLFKQLLDKSPNEQYLKYYLLSLVEQKKNKEAERGIKAYRGRFASSATSKIEIGAVYKAMGELRDAERLYREAVAASSANRNAAVSAASRFTANREFDWALRTYHEAQKRLPQTSFDQEIANVYYYMRDYESMIDVYLNLLSRSEQFLQMVQSRLYAAIYTDTDKSLHDILERRLLEWASREPDKDVYAELLAWLYLERRDYASAFTQTRALDLRGGQQGGRILPLAVDAAQAGDYATALRAYDYVLQAGAAAPYFNDATLGRLDLLYRRARAGVDHTPDALRKSSAQFDTATARLGANLETLPMLLQHIELLTKYLHDTTQAQAAIERASAIRNLGREDRAEIEMLRADVMLARGNLWEAVVIYARTERENSENPLGHQAKYRKALMAYYQHDFAWAESQFDILKGGTSRLISNDAAAMAILIRETLADDNTDDTASPARRALQALATAQLRAEQNLPADALAQIDTLLALARDGAAPYAAVEGANLKSQLLAAAGQHAQAAATLQETLDNHAGEANTDKTLFMLGQIYNGPLADPAKARQAYTTLLRDFGASVYSQEAREALRQQQNSGGK